MNINDMNQNNIKTFEKHNAYIVYSSINWKFGGRGKQRPIMQIAQLGDT